MWIRYHAKSGQKVAHFIFSHAATTKCFAEYIDGKTKRDDSQYQVYPTKYVSYTGLAVASIKGKSVRLTVGG